jgi:hypothetical protein
MADAKIVVKLDAEWPICWPHSNRDLEDEFALMIRRKLKTFIAALSIRTYVSLRGHKLTSQSEIYIGKLYN